MLSCQPQLMNKRRTRQCLHWFKTQASLKSTSRLRLWLWKNHNAFAAWQHFQIKPTQTLYLEEINKRAVYRDCDVSADSVLVAVNLLNQRLTLHHRLPWNKWIAIDISCSVKHHIWTVMFPVIQYWWWQWTYWTNVSSYTTSCLETNGLPVTFHAQLNTMWRFRWFSIDDLLWQWTYWKWSVAIAQAGCCPHALTSFAKNYTGVNPRDQLCPRCLWQGKFMEDEKWRDNLFCSLTECSVEQHCSVHFLSTQRSVYIIYIYNMISCPCVYSQKGGQGCLMSLSAGCHLSPLSYCLSGYSAQSSCSFCLVLFFSLLLMV